VGKSTQDATGIRKTGRFNHTPDDPISTAPISELKDRDSEIFLHFATHASVWQCHETLAAHIAAKHGAVHVDLSEFIDEHCCSRALG